MSSTFVGLSTALNALMSQRAALTVTGQNIANVNTVGYTRQRAELAAIGPVSGAGMNSGTVIDQVGSGVTVTGFTRLADDFVDARQRDARAGLEQTAAQNTALTQVETTINEPSTTGVAASLTAFWSTWHGVASDPTSNTARQTLVSSGSALVNLLQTGHRSLESAHTAARTQLDALTSEANTAAASVAELNRQIRLANATGTASNELLDQRDQQALALASLTGATSSPRADGTIDVTLSGVKLVDGLTAGRLTATGGRSLGDAGSLAVSITAGTPPVTTPATIASGKMGGTIDALTRIYPDASAGYEDVAATLVKDVNDLQAQAQNVKGDPAPPFFSGTSIATLAVSTTAERVGTGARTGSASTNNSMADATAQLALSTTGADSRWSALAATTGIKVRSSTNALEVQTIIGSQADAARSSQSGVSLDEEMANMLTFQRGYEGAARVLTAVDSMLDTLINRTGLVGR